MLGISQKALHEGGQGELGMEQPSPWVWEDTQAEQ